MEPEGGTYATRVTRGTMVSGIGFFRRFAPSQQQCQWQGASRLAGGFAGAGASRFAKYDIIPPYKKQTMLETGVCL